MNASFCRPIAWSTFRRTAASVNRASLRDGGSERIAQYIYDYDIYDVHIAQSRRFIHPTPSLSRSPTRVRVRRARGASEYESDLPPTSILKTAYESGTLQLAPDLILDFLRAFLSQSSAAFLGWERTVCLNHDIDPWTLGVIASILDKCENSGQRKFGRDLLMTAASFGDRASNFKLVHAATSQGRLHEVTESLQHVGILAKTGNDPQAMALLGMALFSQRKEKEALPWLRKATAGALDFPGAADALVLEGRISMSHDEAGAMAAFQRAADELDDPSAYFYLSKLLPPDSAARGVYLIKAAASGVMEASHNLGVTELAKINEGGKQPKALGDYGMARDWTEVAAKGGFGLSMLNMAMMYRNVGLRDQAMEWLEKAGEDTKVLEEAQALRENWDSEDALKG